MTKNLRGSCQRCGGPIEFPADHIGQTAPCPHCGQQTELMLAAPPEEKSPLRGRAVVFVGIAVVILIAGLVGTQLAIKRAKRMTGQDAKPPTTAPATAKPSDPIAQAGFQVSPITIEREAGGRFIYAVGTLNEIAQRKRYGVRIELALFDADGKPCGTAQDYQATLDPGGQWKFRALVVNAATIRAVVQKVSEEK